MMSTWLITFVLLLQNQPVARGGGEPNRAYRDFCISTWRSHHWKWIDAFCTYRFLFACEHNFTGCSTRYYGAHCDKKCPEKCGGDGSCHYLTGECSQGCKSGWWKAKNNPTTCNPGCKAGYELVEVDNKKICMKYHKKYLTNEPAISRCQSEGASMYHVTSFDRQWELVRKAQEIGGALQNTVYIWTGLSFQNSQWTKVQGIADRVNGSNFYTNFECGPACTTTGPIGPICGLPCSQGCAGDGSCNSFTGTCNQVNVPPASGYLHVEKDDTYTAGKIFIPLLSLAAVIALALGVFVIVAIRRSRMGSHA